MVQFLEFGSEPNPNPIRGGFMVSKLGKIARIGAEPNPNPIRGLGPIPSKPGVPNPTLSGGVPNPVRAWRAAGETAWKGNSPIRGTGLETLEERLQLRTREKVLCVNPGNQARIGFWRLGLGSDLNLASGSTHGGATSGQITCQKYMKYRAYDASQVNSQVMRGFGAPRKSKVELGGGFHGQRWVKLARTQSEPNPRRIDGFRGSVKWVQFLESGPEPNPNPIRGGFTNPIRPQSEADLRFQRVVKMVQFLEFGPKPNPTPIRGGFTVSALGEIARIGAEPNPNPIRGGIGLLEHPEIVQVQLKL
ncbi:hypothetical protein C8F01DRAFT_1086314 [Mycena amicta]|nr:hypothetical protein C8F01DRAFT_1086314 [Mycena amicta]